MGYAFISYSTKNQSPADSMRAVLNKRGIETWMAPYDIPIGSRYAQVINQAVKDCSCFVLLLTDAAQNSVWVAKEVERAINYKRVIIPIQLESIQLNDEFELYISSNQIVAVQKIDDSEPVMKRIVDTIEYHCGKAQTASKKGSEASGEGKVKKIKSNSAKATATATKTVAPKTKSTTQDADDNRVVYHGVSADDLAEASNLSGRLHDALSSFGISAKVTDVERGPRVTRYSIVPKKGVSVTKILRLEDDIALALAAESVRIEAPIPGRNAIGIEIPNKKPSIVYLRELTESQSFTQEKSKTTICLGKDVCGNSVFSDIASLPHLLIAGATGTGKSVCMHAMIASIISKATPEDVKLLLLDPKKVEFFPYSELPHLLCPVITDTPKAAKALEWVISEMNRRYELIQAISVRNIDAYNEKTVENPALGDKLPRIVIFIDELNDLMILARDPVENYIMAIAQKARSAGIHIVIGTQRPSVNVITGVIKANIPSRISFKLTSGVDSRTVLDRTGAEKLLSSGDMLFADGKSAGPIRVQGAFISEKEIDGLVKTAIGTHGKASYNTACTSFLSRENSDEREEIQPEEYEIFRDEKFIECMKMTVENRSASISWLQRKLSIGFSKAAKYIDTMIKIGLLNENQNGLRAREALWTLGELEYFLGALK